MTISRKSLLFYQRAIFVPNSCFVLNPNLTSRRRSFPRRWLRFAFSDFVHCDVSIQFRCNQGLTNNVKTYASLTRREILRERYHCLSLLRSAVNGEHTIDHSWPFSLFHHCRVGPAAPVPPIGSGICLLQETLFQFYHFYAAQHARRQYPLVSKWSPISWQSDLARCLSAIENHATTLCNRSRSSLCTDTRPPTRMYSC